LYLQILGINAHNVEQQNESMSMTGFIIETSTILSAAAIEHEMLHTKMQPADQINLSLYLWLCGI